MGAQGAMGPTFAAQAPQPRGARFMDAISQNPEVLLALGSGLLGGRTGAEQWSGGLGNMAQAMGMASERRKEEKRKNETMEWLRKTAPEYAQAVEMGALSLGDAYKMKLEAQKPQKPDFTDDIKEYNFARGQGYNGTFQDFMTEMKRAGATNINMPGQPTIGSIPQGFQAIQGPDGAYRMERIPGGPEDLTANKQAQAKQEAQKASVARKAIQSIRDKVQGGGMFDLPEVGVIGSRLSGINQEAADVKNQLATLQSIVSFDRLQAMREASPTGGALGAVSERELALLQSSLGALSQDSSAEDILATLDFIDSVMAKFEAYPGGMDGAINAPQQQPASGTRKRYNPQTGRIE